MTVADHDIYKSKYRTIYGFTLKEIALKLGIKSEFKVVKYHNMIDTETGKTVLKIKLEQKDKKIRDRQFFSHTAG